MGGTIRRHATRSVAFVRKKSGGQMPPLINSLFTIHDSRFTIHDSSLFFRLAGFHRVTCFLPDSCTAFQGRDVLISVFDQYLYRTGTSMFVRSGTVGDYRFALGHFLFEFLFE